MSASAPTPADPNAVASTQQNTYNTPAAEQSQQGSMVNQVNPYGSLSYSQTGTGANGTPIYTSSLSLSPQQQQLLNSLTGSQTTAGQQAQALLSGANYGATDPTTAIGTGTSGISGQMMSGYLGLMQPFFTNQTNQAQTQLLNQGLTPSPSANPNDPSTWGPYEQEMAQLGATQAQQVGAEAAQFQPAAFNEATQLYQLPAQLGTSLAQFGAPTSPGGSLVQTPGLNITPADYESATATQQQMEEQNYQSQMAQEGQIISGGLGMLGTLGGGYLRGLGGTSGLGTLATV